VNTLAYQLYQQGLLMSFFAILIAICVGIGAHLPNFYMCEVSKTAATCPITGPAGGGNLP
jgi:hypothetical protein